jgi:cyclase
VVPLDFVERGVTVKKVVKVIPCLDMKDGRVVKGIKFVNLRDARDPVEAASTYEKEGADEIAFLDIAATVEKRGTMLEWVKNVRKAISVPFVVGGGIRDIADMEELLNIGVNKISINTAAYRNPDLIANAVRTFGAGTIVVAIDGKKNPLKSKRPRLELVVSGGMEETGVEIVEWARNVEKLGAGEILLTSRDADGTKEGYDLEMTKAVAEAVKIPVTASGGAGKVEHLYEAVAVGKASAVLCASVFHFGEITIPQAKKYLASRGIPVKL